MVWLEQEHLQPMEWQFNHKQLDEQIKHRKLDQKWLNLPEFSSASHLHLAPELCKKKTPACTSLRKAHLCGRHIFAEGTSLRDAQFVSVWCGCNRHTHEITRWVEFRKVVHKRKDIDVYKDSVHTFIYTSYFLCCGHKQTLTRELRLRTHLIHYFSRTSTTTKRQRFVNTSGYNQKCKYNWTERGLRERTQSIYTHLSSFFCNEAIVLKITVSVPRLGKHDRGKFLWHEQTLTWELRLRTHLIHYFSRTSTTTKRQRFVNTSGHNQKCKSKWTNSYSYKICWIPFSRPIWCFKRDIESVLQISMEHKILC